MADKRDIFSAYEASEGVLYLMFGAVLAIHAEAPRLLAIDNFDHALNPRVARAYVRQLCDWLTGSNDRQFLLTSHNPLVLDGLPLQDDRVRLFAVDRMNAGQTMVSRVNVTKKIMKQAEDGIPLSQQWVMGNFGGVPDNV
jgi:predicted ATPase